MPQKDVTKKTSVSKQAKEKHIHIVKHFQPISYCKQHRNYELPEVDNDEDVQEYLNAVTNHKRLSYHERQPKNTTEIYTKNEKITKSTIITRKRNKRGILNTEPCSKSQSSLEAMNKRTTEIQKPYLTKKSKSFSTNVKQPERIYDKNKQKNILISSSSPDFNDTHVTNLRREISLNRCKTADAWLDTKLYLMHKNEIHNEKVRHIREEISKLINVDLEKRKNHVTELKTEIAEFKRNDCIAVYNVETHTSTEVDSENDVKSGDETNKSSTTSIEETSKDDNANTEVVEVNAVTLTTTDEERNEKEITNTDLTGRVETDESGKPICEKLCLLEDKNMANAGLYNLNISDQEDFIKAKILEANMLIDRVKDTLCDIKNKSKRDNQEPDTYANKVSDADALKSLMCCELPESVRPKTRRPMSCEKELDVEDKFKNTLCDKLEATESLEVLQAKLNTIIEQTESDSMSGSEYKENDDVKVTADAQIQVSTAQQSSAAQVTPYTVSTGVQITNIEMKTAATQTDSRPKKLCLDTNCVVTIPTANPKLCKMQKLNIQNMPPINIKRDLVVQRVLKFHIDSQGRTYYISQDKEKNNQFYEIGHTDTSSNVKIKFDKNLNGWIKGTNSELSFFADNMDQNPSSLRRVCSHSDGELILLRKKQLKESMEPRTTENLINRLQRRSEAEDDTFITRLQTRSGRVTDGKANLSKELILKSFHIYDNPNFHDPGETQLPVNVNTIDTYVYRTYINPDGLPNASSVSNNRPMNMSIITPETLQKISQHKPVYVKNQASGENRKISSSITEKKNQSIAVGNMTDKKQFIPISPTYTNKKMPINIYDLGLYSAKATQVETSSFKSSVSTTPEKPKIELEKPKPEKASVSSYDNSADMSYERISITVSYSSEDTVNSDSLVSKDFDQHRVSDYIQEHERELHTVEPSRQVPAPDNNTVSKGSQETFLILKEKFAKEGYKDKDRDHLVRDGPSFQTVSAESTIPEFIMSLTESTSHDLKKLIPHIRRNVTGSIAEKQSKHSGACNDTSSSRKLCTFNDRENKDSSKANKQNTDYTVLSMQTHGDCIPNDSKMIDPHLRLGKNGRYKDEENLFCDYHPKLKSLSMRRRAFKNTPRHSYVNKCALDSSSGDAVPAEPTLSEGEIKCHSSASIGEVRRNPPLDHFSKIRQKMTHTNLGSDPNVIRERRTYFNHWITYYINKNAGVPFLSQSSSTSST